MTTYRATASFPFLTTTTGWWLGSLVRGDGLMT